MIFPSTLFIANNFGSALPKIKEIIKPLNQEISINNPDLFFVNNETGWGIDYIRQIKNFLSKKPFNHQSKLVIIENSEKLNTESQNALLKTLEEPGNNNYLILTVDKLSSLLPTIISRCHIIKIIDKNPDKKIHPISISKDLVKNLNESEKLSSKKEEVLILLENQLIIFQKELVKNPNKETAFLIKKIAKAINMINSNVDPKSAMDYIFIA